MDKYIIGIDLGGTTVKMGLFRACGNLVEVWEIPTDTLNNGENILSDIAVSIKQKIAQHQDIEKDILGIGLGVPGPVDAKGILHRCVNLGWGVFNVEERLSELTGMRVKAGNDANIAALGEMWQGGAKGCYNVVMVTLGTGVGGGFIMNGEMIYGRHGAGGEIGHIQMSKDESRQCGCGKRGCLEQYASASGVVRYAKQLLDQEHDYSLLDCESVLTAKKVFDCAKEGDPLANQVVEFFGENLGTALAHIASVCDPDVFVIGGGLSKAGGIVLEAVKKHYQDTAFHAMQDTEIVLAKLGNEAGIYGGAYLFSGSY